MDINEFAYSFCRRWIISILFTSKKSRIYVSRNAHESGSHVSSWLLLSRRAALRGKKMIILKILKLVTGLPPFYSHDTDEIYQSILSEELTFP